MASVNFINECKNYAYMNRYGKLEFTNPTLELNQSNKIQEFSIDSGCYVEGNIVGSVYAKKITAQLIDTLDDTLVNRRFDASVGVKYDDDSTEYINLGSWVVEKPNDEQTDNYTSFIAYDLLMEHLEEKYYSNLEYDSGTITIGDVYEELCNHLGLIPVTTTFTNSTIIVDDNPFTNNETNRVVLNAIAKVACAFVDVDYDTNKIDLKWLSNSLDYTFQKSDYSTVEGGKIVYGPLNSLIIKSSAVESENVSHDDSESIALNGEHQLVISEDYFLYSQEKRNEALMPIWNKVNGLTYTECTLTTLLGKPFLKVGSKIRIYLDTDKYIDSYILQNEFKFDGTFYTKIKCPVLTEQEIKTKQKATLVEKMRQTEIIVNKQSGEIKSIAKDLEDNYSTTTQMNSAITQKASEINSTVSETYETKTDATSKLNSSKGYTDTKSNALSTRIGQTAKSIALTVNNGSTSSGITITTTKEDGTTSTAQGTIQMNGLVTFNNLKTSGQTQINGDNLTTGVIKSSNYVANTSGTKIDLSNGVIDSKNFKIDSTGTLTAKNGIFQDGDIVLTDTSTGAKVLEISREYNSSVGAYNGTIYINGFDGSAVSLEHNIIRIIGSDGNHWVSLEGETGNIYQNGANIFDMGSSGIWTYMKFSNGFAICWGTYVLVPKSMYHGEIYITLLQLSHQTSHLLLQKYQL